MRLLDLTLPTPELNLALDEALLLDAAGGECLRFWEAPEPFVVLGRSSRRDEEASLDACSRRGVPVLRRVSGGASILTGPGCLMYAVTLDARRRPGLMDLTHAHRFVLQRLVAALRGLDPSVSQEGTSDLALSRDGESRKFSGNSLRRVRERLLYHGTLLYGFDLPLIGELLAHAPRQPAYRTARDHTAFVTNLAAPRDALVAAVASAWGAESAEVAPGVLTEAERLAATKYSDPAWNASR